VDGNINRTACGGIILHFRMQRYKIKLKLPNKKIRYIINYCFLSEVEFCSLLIEEQGGMGARDIYQNAHKLPALTINNL
jgi:hypothetical protein